MKKYTIELSLTEVALIGGSLTEALGEPIPWTEQGLAKLYLLRERIFLLVPDEDWEES